MNFLEYSCKYMVVAMTIPFLFLITQKVYSQSISTSTISPTAYCQGNSINVPFSITGSFNVGNVFTAELSDENGNFSSPTSIGTLSSTSSGTINATLPNLLQGGNNYRIRVVGNNPVVIGSDNGADLTLSGSTTDPNTFGDSTWHVYGFNISSYTNNPSNFTFDNYRGFYVENTLNINSSDYWGTTSNPSTAASWEGCSMNDNLFNISYKRKGFPCGTYQINIAGPGNQPGHDDAARLVIDGVTVWSNTGCCAARINVWQGDIGPSTEIEFTVSENGGNAYGRLTFVPLTNNLQFELDEITICQGTSTYLRASNGMNYDWTINTTYLVPPYDEDSVLLDIPLAAPNGTLYYQVQATDTNTGCTTTSDSLTVTVDNTTPVVTVSPNSGSYCGNGSVNVTASGAKTYSWSPMTDISINSCCGAEVTLSPDTTTIYTVTGSIGCDSSTAQVTINVQQIGGNPNDFGDYTWNVYAYDGNNFNTYRGFYVHNTLNFDTRDVWNNNGNPSQAPGYSGCSIPNDFHSFRYKRKGFDCGFYQLDIPNHDDAVNLIIDGVSVFSQNSWFSNNYKANVWRGVLGPETEIEYTVRENTGGSNGGLAFIYLDGPNLTPNSVVWNGSVDGDWFNVNNWCDTIPDDSLTAIIPGAGVDNFPDLSTNIGFSKGIKVLENAQLNINGQSLNIRKNLDVDGALNLTNAKVNFIGAGNSEIITPGNLSINEIEINKQNIADSVMLNQNITITDNLNFISGTIGTRGNILIFDNNATASNASNSSFVDGNVRKIGNQAFEFPVGNRGEFAPISISAPTNATDAFEARYLFENPWPNYSGGQREETIDHISSREFWTLDRVTGSAAVSVTLSWAGRSAGIDTPSDVIVARWDGSQWVSHGNGGITGNNALGTVLSSAPISSFSPFTLASTSENNPLPVTLSSFKVNCANQGVQITWTTQNELNHHYFELERSEDAAVFEPIHRVYGEPDGFSNSIKNYSFLDVNANKNSVYYYRLKQLDFDGTQVNFDVDFVNCSNVHANAKIFLFPNPAKNKVNIQISEDEINHNLNVYDIYGRLVLKNINFNNSLNTVDISSLTAGQYIFKISSENKKDAFFKLNVY